MLANRHTNIADANEAERSWCNKLLPFMDNVAVSLWRFRVELLSTHKTQHIFFTRLLDDGKSGKLLAEWLMWRRAVVAPVNLPKGIELTPLSVAVAAAQAPNSARRKKKKRS